MQQIKTAPSPELYDDLGVAYEKIGNHLQAINTMIDKERLYPGLYTTESNLGTFWLFEGQTEECLKHIRRAIEINPEAHFGREIYQALLVEYMMSREQGGRSVLPLSKPVDEGERESFAKFVARQMAAEGDEPWRKKLSMAAALEGVLGMMRFANYDSPILLEALGDLLAETKPERVEIFKVGSKMLAARAYIKASWEVDDIHAKSAYRKLATQLLAGGLDPKKGKHDFQKTEAALCQEVRDARKWYEGVAADEQQWIKEGKNPDTEFAAKYFEAPAVKARDNKRPRASQSTGQGFF